MYSPMAPCPSCSRHVRTNEPSCPFCKVVLPESLADAVVPGTTPRLSRAAAIAFTASLAVTGCGGTQAQLAPTDSGTKDGSSGSDATTDGPSDDGGYLVHYGAPPYGLPPPPIDAGEPDDAGDDATD